MRQPRVALLSSDNKFWLGELAAALDSSDTRIITFRKTAGVLQRAGVELQETGVIDGRITENIHLSDGNTRQGIASLLLPRIVNTPVELEASGLSPIDLIYVNLVPPKFDDRLGRVLPDAIGVNYILQGLMAGRIVVTEPSSLNTVAAELQSADGFSTAVRDALATEAASHVERHMHQYQAQQPVTV